MGKYKPLLPLSPLKAPHTMTLLGCFTVLMMYLESYLETPEGLRTNLYRPRQGRIYYEANEASASGPHHLGGPHQNFNAVSKPDFFIS